MEVKMDEQCEALYDKALTTAMRSEEGKGKTFTADELLDLDVVTNKNKLMPLIQQLADRHEVRFLQLEGKPQFALRSRDVAGRMKSLTRDEKMVYECIEGAGVNGMWQKRIKDRTGISQATVLKIIRALVNRQLIKDFTNIKNPSQKTFILAYLDPGDSVSGGPWHSDNEFDLELIGVTSDAIIRFIASKSWEKGYVKRERSISPMPALPDSQHPMPNGKRKASAIDGDIEGVHPKSKRRQSQHRIETQIPYPAGYQHYPDAAAILHFIKESGIIKTTVPMDEAAVQNLLDVLVYDDQLEKIGQGYRTVKGIREASDAMKYGKLHEKLADDEQENPLTQAPCGQCPVFDLCEPGGPINAQNCEYFQNWLRS
ncbi:hypothetical protein MBLNU457_5038t1 [Dothideomycetes sp. NU457]